jgi:hypothetical protein
MTIPTDIRDEIRKILWAAADKLDWSFLSDAGRSKYYEQWTRDPSIGGRLGHFMDPRQVRVYIKDSLLKPYERTRMSENEDKVWRTLGLPVPGIYAEAYIKPHGKRLLNGSVVCWGKSRDWKSILMTVFERSHSTPSAKPLGVVLVETGPTAQDGQRDLVKEAARRLGIEKVAWLE